MLVLRVCISMITGVCCPDEPARPVITQNAPVAEDDGKHARIHLPKEPWLTNRLLWQLLFPVVVAAFALGHFSARFQAAPGAQCDQAQLATCLADLQIFQSRAQTA